MGGRSAIHDIGKRFERLVITGMSPDKRNHVVAACDCGGVWVGKISPLRDGRVKSCGCLSSELTTNRNVTHGLSKTPEYKVWKGMLRRCNDTGHQDYYLYGGRGIKVTREWEDFVVFYSDMGSRPSSQHSIDRKDSNGMHCASNCRWATKTEQARNTSRNRRYLHKGNHLTIREIAEMEGVPYYTLKNRVYGGSTVESALARPFKTINAKVKFKFEGLEMTLTDWSRHLGVGLTTLIYRLKAGWAYDIVFSSVKQK